MKAMQQKIEQQQLDMRAFYNFDRFDIDYLSDAIMFTKIETAPSQHQVVITTPGTRTK